MATPTDPTTPTAEDLTATTAAANGAKTAIDALNNVVTGLANNLLNLTSKVTDLNKGQKDTVDLSKNVTAGFDAMTLEIFGASKAFDVFKEGTQQLQLFSDQISGLGDATSKVTGLLGGLAKAGGFTGSTFGRLAGEFGSFIGQMATGADNAIRLQQGYLSMMGASGGLGGVFQESGDHLSNLNGVMAKQMNLINDVAGATGASTKQVTGFYNTLGTAIPNSVSAQVSATTQAGEKMNQLQAAMSLAAGTGRSVESVISDMGTAWETYGLQGDEALQFTARMSDLSQKFGINLSYTEDLIKGNADSFKILSDNAVNVDKTFNRMFEAFTKTGLSAKQSTDIIKGMNASLTNLSLAEKGFLSARTGGPGGLRGAYQIENLIREGKTDEVMKKLEDNLKRQFGGRIYTQKEAGESDYAASQFTKQRELIKSPAFGGLAKDDATATRILEAMRNGTNATKELESGSMVVSNAVSKGTEIQGTTNTILNQILHSLERGREEAGLRSLGLIQKTTGEVSNLDRDKGGLGDRTAEYLRRERLNQSKTASNTGQMIGRHDMNEKPNQYQDGTEAMKNIASAAKAVIGKREEAPAATKLAISVKNAPKEHLENQNKSDMLLAKTHTDTTLKTPVNRGMQVASVVPRQLPRPEHQELPRSEHHMATKQQLPQTQKVEINLNGVYCAGCGKPVRVDPHTTVVTGQGN